MELRHLRYFVAVAQELHFGRAAKTLRISQPPLSQQIRALEFELGVELLKRTKREVHLTPAGKAFLERARKVLADVEVSTDVVRRAARGEIGTLEVGYVAPADVNVLPKAVRKFRTRFPGVRVVLRPLSTSDQLEALREARIDFGFFRLPVESDDVVVELVLREPLILATPQDHPLSRLPRVKLRALADVPCILFPRRDAPLYHDFLLGFARRAGHTLQVTWEAANVYEELSLVAAGLGVSLVARSVEKVRREGVVYRRMAPPVPWVEMGIGYRREEPSEVQKAFLRVVRELCPAARPT
jgi:DNA-binding transcriptional LysR family regulator